MEIRYLKMFGIGILIIFKSFWNATVKCAWGISGLILLGGMILQYGISTTILDSLFEMNRFLINNWIYFWFMFFILNISDDWYRINNLRFVNCEGGEE